MLSAGFVVLIAGIILSLSSCGDDVCFLVIVTSSLPHGVVGQIYIFDLNGDCGDRWLLVSGSLPPGITLKSDGRLSGTPTIAGDYSFTVGLQDSSSGDESHKEMLITITE